MDVQNRIKVVLAERSKSNRWLSQTLGIDEVTVSRWVNNKHQPNLQSLAQIAGALDIPVSELIAGADAVPSGNRAKGARVYVLFLVTGDGGAWHPSVWADVAEMVGSVRGAGVTAEEILEGLKGGIVFQFSAGSDTYFVFSTVVR